MESLFAYGTLREDSIQRAVFNRSLEGTSDQLAYYKSGFLDLDNQSYITDGEGDHVYPVVISTNNQKDVVEGTVYKLSSEELTLADRYEGSGYKRIRETLKSGQTCWVYVKA